MIIFQKETLNLQGIYTFFKVHIYSTIINKKMMYLGNFKHLLTSWKSFHSKIHFYEKVILGKIHP
jgi:hypothetical protein